MALYSENSSTNDSSASTTQRDANYGGSPSSSSSRSSTPASRDMAHALAAAASYSPASPQYSTPSGYSGYSGGSSNSRSGGSDSYSHSDMAHSVAPAYSNPSQPGYSDRSGYSGGSMAPPASGTLANSQGSQNPSSQGYHSDPGPSMGLGAAIRAGMGSDAPSYAPQITTAPSMVGSMTAGPPNPFNHRGPPQGFMSPSQQYQDRMQVSNGSMLNKSMNSQYGLGPSIVTANEMAKTSAGELNPSQQTPSNLAAIQQTMINRMGIMQNDGSYHGSPKGVLGYYDANGYDQPRVMKNGVGPLGDGQYQKSTFGSPQLLKASTALYGQLSGTGPALPPGVKDATNYVARTSALAPWEKDQTLTPFGPHRFSNPDPGRSRSDVAAVTLTPSPGAQYSHPNKVQVASVPPVPQSPMDPRYGVSPPVTSDAQPNPNRVQVSDVPQIPMDPRYGTTTPSASDGSPPVSPAVPQPQYRPTPGSPDTRVAENSPAVAPNVQSPTYPMPPVPGSLGAPPSPNYMGAPPTDMPRSPMGAPPPQFMAPSMPMGRPPAMQSPPTYSGPHAMPMAPPSMQVASGQDMAHATAPAYNYGYPKVAAVLATPNAHPAQIASAIASVPALAKVASTNPTLIQRLVSVFQSKAPAGPNSGSISTSSSSNAQQQQIAAQVLQIATAEPTGDSDAQINALLQQLSNPNYNKSSVKVGLTKLTPKTGSFA